MNEGRFVFTQVVDFVPRYQFDRAGSYFIMRLKDYMRFDFIREFSSGQKDPSIICDYVIRMARDTSLLLYPEELRIVKVMDSQTNEIITFITNYFEISA